MGLVCNTKRNTQCFLSIVQQYGEDDDDDDDIEEENDDIRKTLGNEVSLFLLQII